MPRDAVEIAVIWHDGWRDGHLGHVPDELAAARSERSFRLRAEQRIDGTVVAAVGAAVAGFIMVVGDELEQIYVSHVHRGSGVASALLAEAERLISAAGYLQAWLAVVPGNVRARRFYVRHGWTDDGDIYYPAASEAGQILIPARRYTKDLLADHDV